MQPRWTRSQRSRELAAPPEQKAVWTHATSYDLRDLIKQLVERGASVTYKHVPAKSRYMEGKTFYEVVAGGKTMLFGKSVAADKVRSNLRKRLGVDIRPPERGPISPSVPGERRAPKTQPVSRDDDWSNLGFLPEFGNLWPVYLMAGSIGLWLWQSRKA